MTSHKAEALAALAELCDTLDGTHSLRREVVEWWALANLAMRHVQAIEELKRPRRAKKDAAVADLTSWDAVVRAKEASDA